MTSPGRRQIDRILDEAYLHDLADADLESLRSRRRECEDVEGVLSYQRRWLHGKIDMIGAEIERRGATNGTAVLDRLGTILSDQAPASRRGARVRIPVEIPADARRYLDRLVSEDHLSRLPDLGGPELTEILERLADAEAQVSADRKGVLRVIDSLQSEIVRRYKADATR